MTLNPQSLEGKPFEIRSLSSAGQSIKGLFASRDIKKGELIIAEKPLFVCRGNFAASFEKLSHSDKELFLTYTDAYESDTRPKTVTGIARTNSLPLGDRPDEAGFFPICSLFNHSCSPNVTHRFHRKQFVEKFFAVRDITAGDQLCTSYMDVHDTLSNRQQEIVQGFNFNCTCTFCSELNTNSTKLVASDRNRSKLLHLDENFPDLLYTPQKAIALTEGRIQLMIEEGLEYLISSAYYDSFQICIAYRQLTSVAQEFAKKAFDFAVLHYGGDSDLAQNYLVYVNNPTTHKNAWLLG
ncbi:hypothetical protein GEMRC1_012434 [Eukaryota sp. GEM-RC1]